MSMANSTPSTTSAAIAAAHSREGELDGTTVICPWHGWRYNVTTGENELIPALPTEKFDVQLQGDDVLVDLG